MKKVIIIGASSGIGKGLAEHFLQRGDHVGIVGRRTFLLKNIANSYPTQTYIKTIDINNIEITNINTKELIQEMGGIDIIIVSAGVGFMNTQIELKKELDTIQTNIIGYTNIINIAYQYFAKKKTGTIAVITSVSALRGSGDSPSYAASKAFQSNYIRGIRHNTKKLGLNIHIMEAQPGFIDTKMAQGNNLFRVSPITKAASQIYLGIIHKKEHIYVSKRRLIVGRIMKAIPDFLYRKI